MLESEDAWPCIRHAGYDGFVVSFSDALDDGANRAALAFAAALDETRPEGVTETSTTLVSTYIQFDPTVTSHDAMRAALERLVGSRDWWRDDWQIRRARLWHVPTVFGGLSGPALDECARAAGHASTGDAIAAITRAPLRVLTIGFAPGMPYLGTLPQDWNLPRRKKLSRGVPAGALCLAIRQLVLFPVTTQTGWHHIGQTAAPLFRPDANTPFLLRPGDMVQLNPVEEQELDRLRETADGGVWSEAP